MSTFVSTHRVTSIEFVTVPHEGVGNGGFITISGRTETDKYDVTLHTWRPEVFDCFRNIERALAAQAPGAAQAPKDDYEAPHC